LVNRYVVFSSPLFLEYLLPIFLENGINIPIFTGKFDIHRKASDKNIGNYRSFFNIVEIDSSSYSSGRDQIKGLNNKIAIFIDWNKDFFDLSSDFFAVYCQPSLLPMYRGYGAITRQFVKGVSVSGLTLYLPSEITDGGDILFQREIRIEFEDYPDDFILKICNELTDIIKTTDLSKINPTPQNNQFSFSLSRIRKKEGIIDFRMDALAVYNHIRGYSRPFFGAFCYCDGFEITVWKAKPEKWQGVYGYPGEILNINSNGIEVACGNGTVILTDIETEMEIKTSFILNNYLKVD